jgi:cyclopropane fatty-acyl-phospholipid synthase-like methyltransferase
VSTLLFTEEQALRLEATYSTPNMRDRRQETLRLLALSPGETVIDIGCGPELPARCVCNGGATAAAVTCASQRAFHLRARRC